MEGDANVAVVLVPRLVDQAQMNADGALAEVLCGFTPDALAFWKTMCGVLGRLETQFTPFNAPATSATAAAATAAAAAAGARSGVPVAGGSPGDSAVTQSVDELDCDDFRSWRVFRSGKHSSNKAVVGSVPAGADVTPMAAPRPGDSNPHAPEHSTAAGASPAAPEVRLPPKAQRVCYCSMAGGKPAYLPFASPACAIKALRAVLTAGAICRPLLHVSARRYMSKAPGSGSRGFAAIDTRHNGNNNGSSSIAAPDTMDVDGTDLSSLVVGLPPAPRAKIMLQCVGVTSKLPLDSAAELLARLGL